MTTYSTQNPLGSSDPRDLYDNAENLDNFVNGEQPAYDDRLGQARKSWAGMEQDFADFLANSGYQFIGDYAAGIEVTAHNQVIREDGELWRVSAGTDLPYTTTGAGMPEGGAFVAVGEGVLRQELGTNTAGEGSDLIAHTGTSDTVTEALNNRVIRVSSRTEMKAYDVPDGYQFIFAGYNWIVKTGTPPTDTYEGIYVVLNNGNYAERQYEGFIDVRWFQTPDDGSDVTDYLMSAQTLGDRILLAGGGSYGVNTTTASSGFDIQDNKTIAFEPGTKLVAVNSNSPEYNLLRIVAKNNVTIINPWVVGDRDTNTAGTGEKGHLIFIYQSTNVNVLNVSGQGYLEKAFGDGLYVGGDTANCETIRVEGIISDNNRRQGLSVTAAIGATFRDCHFKNTNGTPPQYGVDIEPNNATVKLQGIRFYNCTASNNASGVGFGLYGLAQSSNVDIKFVNCKTIEDRFEAKRCSGFGLVELVDCVSSDFLSNSLRLDDCTLPLKSKITVINPNSSGSTNPDTGSACVLIGPVADFDCKFVCNVETPSEPGFQFVCSQYPGAGSAISGRLEVDGNIERDKLFRKLSNNATNTQLTTSIDREYNYSGNLTNSLMRTLPAYYSILTNEGFSFTLDHEIGTEAEFKGHRIGLRSYQSDSLRFSFTGSGLVYPGGFSQYTTTTRGSFVEFEFDGTNWQIIKEIGTWVGA